METSWDQLFATPDEVSDFMPCELSNWSYRRFSLPGWVFWSRHSNELRSLLGSLKLNSDVDTTPVFGNQTIAAKIKDVLSRTDPTLTGLIQFWAPVGSEGRTYLTTADQPFVLTKLQKGLCAYRKLCVANILIPVDDVNEHTNVNPLARVFHRGIHEACGDVSNYLVEEFPLRDYAVEYGIKIYSALPVFDAVEQQIVGVMEVLLTVECGDHFRFGVHPSLEGTGLNYDGPHTPISSLQRGVGYQLANQIMKRLRRSHRLPYVQLWIGNSSERYITRISRYYTENKFYDTVFWANRMFDGEGVAGKAFSSRGTCFCNNVSQLSMSVYPIVLHAREYGLAGCFAVCIQSNLKPDQFYILESFWYHDQTNNENPRDFLSFLIVNLKEEIKSSKRAALRHLGEKVFVEVIKVSSDDDLESFEVGRPWVSKQHDHERVETRNNTCVEQNSNAVNKDRDITTGQPSKIAFSSFDATKRSNVSLQALCHGGEIDVVHDRGNETTQHGKVRTLEAEYRISRKILEQHSGKKLKDVADTLGVSRSTLKRICRKNDIFRWPPCKGKNIQDSIQATERHTEDHHYIQNRSLSDLPQQKQVVSRPHTLPDPTGEQDNSYIIIKATYGDDMIKFQLPLSSGKLDLENQVATRLNLSVGSFKIRYRDEDEDWILVTCDADLRACLSASRLSANTTIKMSVSNLKGTMH